MGWGRRIPGRSALLVSVFLSLCVVARAANGADVPASPPSPLNDSAYLAAQAEVHLQFGRAELAIPLLEKAIEKGADSPEMPRWRMSLASAYIQSGRKEEGIGLLDGLGESDNLAVRTLAYMSLGRYFQSEGQPEKAIEYYDRVALHAEGKYQSAAARKRIAEVLGPLPSRAEHLERYDAMLTADPKNLQLLRLVAEVQSRLGEGPGRALELLRKLRDATPDDGEVWVEYLKAAEAAGEIDEAVAQYQVLRKKLPVYNQFCCENLARLAKKRGKPDEVKQWIAESAGGRHEGPLLALRLGRLYAALDMPEEAEASLREAVDSAETEGQRAGAALDLARTLIKQERFDEAKSLLWPIREAPWVSIREQAVQLLDICEQRRTSVNPAAVPTPSPEE